MSKIKIGNGSPISRVFLKAVVSALAASLLLSTPAQAEFSEGYKFLDSVKKKEGEKVEQAIMDSAQIVNARDITTGETALHIVTRRRDLTWLNFLVGHGANVNQGDDHGVTPLQLAVGLGWDDGAVFLVEHGASTDVSNDAGETPLITAVHQHDRNLIKALLQAGADPNRTDNSGRSARDYAKQESDSGNNLIEVFDMYAKKGPAKSAKPVYGPVL